MKIATRLLIKLTAGVCASAVLTAGMVATQSAKPTASWNQIANIKEMAAHIGKVQRGQGADKAMSFIDACYRTHSLGSVYSKSFEGCIIADYLLAQALVAVINRVPAEELRNGGSATPAEIANAVQSRIVAGFGQYSMGNAEAKALLALVDQHGMPVFLLTVFPKAASDKP
jgi:hypothetical protein